MPRRFAPTATSAEYALTFVGNLAGFVERNGEYPAAEPHNTPHFVFTLPRRN